MKRFCLILFVALISGGLAYCLYYAAAMRPIKALMAKTAPEMEWLRQEFQLNDEQYRRISTIRDEFQPRCERMCEKMAANEKKLAALIDRNTTMTPEVQAAMAERQALEDECRRAMLDNAYAVSQAMSPASGRKYVEMMKARIVQFPNAPVTEQARNDSRTAKAEQ